MDGQKRSRKRAATYTLGRSLASPPHTSPHHHITTILNAICACHSSTEHCFVLLPSPKIPNSETQRTHSDHSPELLCSPSRHSGIIIGFSSLIYSHRAIHSQTIGTNAAGCSAVNVGEKKNKVPSNGKLSSVVMFSTLIAQSIFIDISRDWLQYCRTNFGICSTSLFNSTHIIIMFVEWIKYYCMYEASVYCSSLVR